MMRQKYTLTDREFNLFRNLRHTNYQGAAWNFWKSIAASRGVDPETLITSAPNFTALPNKHGKHWCFPIPLKNKKKPVYNERF